MPTGFSPAQVKAAYGLNAISFTAGGQTFLGDGSGQTIAIVVAFHDPNLASDLQQFDAAYGLPAPALLQVNLSDSTNTNDGWAGETTLDVEWAHAIAPGSKILVVEAATDNIDDLITAVNTARNSPGVVVVSMSWGGKEMANEASYDPTFTTPSGHQGITFIAATGDTGSGGVQWPATSPNVLAVGGTSLSINGANGYGGESAWSGGSSGLSRYAAEPNYQKGVQSTGRRSVPDVSFLANPNGGVSVYTTLPSSGLGGWSVVGGTSLGAPAWAGIVAIVDQGLVLSGRGTLDGATQLLPLLYALSSADFHSVANSSATVSAARGGASTVSTTGLGTPVGQLLITAIVQPTAAPPQGPSGVTGTTTTTTIGGTGTTTDKNTTTSGKTPLPSPTGWWPIFGGTFGGTVPVNGTTKGHGKAPVKVRKPVVHHVPKSHTLTGKTTRVTHHLSAADVIAPNVPNVFQSFDRAIAEFVDILL